MMLLTSVGGTRFTEIEAARILLEKMGLTPADLLRTSAEPPVIPASAEYIPRVSEAVSTGRTQRRSAR
jgi:hypothetical protein